MLNPNLNIFFNFGTGMYDFVIEKNTGISVAVDIEDWKHNERTTKKLRFSENEKIYENSSCITFKRMFRGQNWYLKINKVV